MDEDFLLICAIKNGNEDAVEKFVCKYYTDMIRFCSSKIKDINQAEDLVQQTFLQFFQSLCRYEHRGKAKNYLYIIAGNLSKNYLARKQVDYLEQIQEEPISKEFQSEVAVRISVQQAIDILPEQLREIIQLYYFQELKIREISSILGIATSNVKYRLKSARDKLSEILRKEDFEL